MNVDCYQSKSRPAYRLVVPAGTNLDSFTGDVAGAISKMQSLENRKTAPLETVFLGDLLAYLQTQIAEHGAGLVKTDVQFSEIAG